MTADRRTAAWAAKYHELLKEYTSVLGGKDITPVRARFAETISTLQCELSQLTDRFAHSGKGGSREDLDLYLKLTNTIAELMQSAGIAPAQQPPIVDQSRGDDARDKLRDIIVNHIRARETENAQGIFRDSAGAVIVDPRRLELEKQIFELQQRRDALDDDPQSDSEPGPLVITAPLPPPALTVVATVETRKPAAAAPPPRPAEPTLTLEQARKRAMQPSIPDPPRDPNQPPSTNDLFYEWMNSGAGRRMWWGPA